MKTILLSTILFIWFTLSVFADGFSPSGGSATNVSGGTFNNVTLTGTSTIPVATTATTATNGASGGNIATNTYNLNQFGAKGDAKFTDGVLAISNSTAVTVTYGNFNAGDIGSYIGISGGGTNRQMWWTGISNVVDATHIVLSNSVYYSYNQTNADTNVIGFGNGFWAIYGKYDDSSAIQSWINQVTNAVNGIAIDLLAPAGNYLILTNAQLPNQNYAQIIVPVPGKYASAANDFHNSEPVMYLRGVQGSVRWGVNNIGLYHPNGGTVFISNLENNPLANATNIIGASVFDFRAYNSGAASATIYSSYANRNGVRYNFPDNPIHPRWTDISLVMSFDSGCVGLNFLGASETELSHISVLGGAFDPSQEPRPTGTNGFGIIMPGNFNGSGSPCDNLFVEGCYNGIDLGLMSYGNYITLSGCYNGFTTSFSATSSQIIDNVQIISTPAFVVGSGRGIYGGSGSGAFSSHIFLNLNNYQITTLGQNVPAWQTNVFDVYDPSNQFSDGAISYNINSSYGVSPNDGRGATSLFRRIVTSNTVVTTDVPNNWLGAQSFLNTVSVYSSPDAWTFFNEPLTSVGNSSAIGAYYGTSDHEFASIRWRNNSRWYYGVDSRGTLNSSYGDFVVVPAVYASSSFISPGIGGNGAALDINTNGDLTMWGSITSSNGVFNGNGAGLTNLPFTALSSSGQSSVTNAASQVYSNNPASYVTASITNGLATTNYVNAATNGIGTSVSLNLTPYTNGTPFSSAGLYIVNVNGTNATLTIPMSGYYYFSFSGNCWSSNSLQTSVPSFINFMAYDTNTTSTNFIAQSVFCRSATTISSYTEAAYNSTFFGGFQCVSNDVIVLYVTNSVTTTAGAYVPWNVGMFGQRLHP